MARFLPCRVGLLAVATLLTLLATGLPWRPQVVAAAAQVPGATTAGHFYRKANGFGGQGNTGYAITNAGGIPFWDAYRQMGGPDALGYPASRRFVWDGFTVQAMQKVVLQWRPNSRRVLFVNVLDQLHEAGKDSWLLAYRQTPAPFDTAPDTGLAWPAVEQRHWKILSASPAIQARYWADPDPIDHFGLPMSSADEGESFVIRCQRVVFQYWKVNVPWATAGQVTIANGGDLAKEAGLFPLAAITPQMASGAGMQPSPPSHDWHAAGFVGAVGGQLIDPQGVVLRSVGVNVPNMAYGEDISANLTWMLQHHLRWMRVFATGHGLAAGRAPANAAAAITALHALLHQVDTFNAAHDPSQAIYVLVSLTDYYPPGVPGDRYAYDHPIFKQSPVLPAPWYRAGVRSFSFDQEHHFGIVHNLPNYEVNYKPWVEQIVPAFAQQRSLLGWQLGNELKARGSPRNGISSEQAYEWYLAFTRDMVDTIRTDDGNHAIFMGAQYMAELTDWPYRPKNQLNADRLPQYDQLVQRMLDDCGTACWNVWSLTAYDFNPYPIDDAMRFHQAGVAVIATEYGFTLGTPQQNQAIYGGDRAAAVRSGFARPWEDIDGHWHSRQWSVPMLIAKTGLAGIALWGAPAPGITASLDSDPNRGITGAPDQSALWSAWGDVAAGLGAAQQTVAPPTGCCSPAG